MKTEIALTHVIDAVASLGSAVEALARSSALSSTALVDLKDTVLSLAAALDALRPPSSAPARPQTKVH